MFGFHKSKIYRSNDGCCICKTKSSSSRFTDSGRYEETFRLCFGLSEDRVGDICNACVLLVKRWKKLPNGSKKNWNHVVDARAGPGFKLTKPKKMKTGDVKRKSKLKKLHKFKRQNSDAQSTTSSMSPSQSPSYSNQSDDGSDIESKQRRSTPTAFSFLDRSYWKRQKICCGIVYKGRFGEVIIDPRLFKPCCSSKKQNTLVPAQVAPHLPDIRHSLLAAQAAASAPPPLGVTLNAVQSVAFTSPPTPSHASPSTPYPSHASPSTLHPSQPPLPGKLQVCVAAPGPGPLVVQQRLDQTSSSLEAALQAVERKLTQDDVSDGGANTVKSAGTILDDIGNMFDDLADQLDAMLD